MMGGVLVDFDVEEGSCTMEFNISHDFCHSVDIVQGGFVTAMLDASMSHASYYGVQPRREYQLFGTYQGWQIKSGRENS